MFSRFKASRNENRRSPDVKQDRRGEKRRRDVVERLQLPR